MARLSGDPRVEAGVGDDERALSATTYWQNEWDSGVSRRLCHGSGSPTAPGKTCRSGLDDRHQGDRDVEQPADQARVVVEVARPGSVTARSCRWRSLGWSGWSGPYDGPSRS